MTTQIPNGPAIYAALSEQVSRRHPQDQQLTDADIFNLPNVGYKSTQIAESTVLTSTDAGYYYNTVENNGFVALVVKVGSQYTVVFRGTDFSGDFF